MGYSAFRRMDTWAHGLLEGLAVHRKNLALLLGLEPRIAEDHHLGCVADPAAPTTTGTLALPRGRRPAAAVGCRRGHRPANEREVFTHHD